jgi:hypothetical protein
MRNTFLFWIELKASILGLSPNVIILFRCNLPTPGYFMAMLLK